MRIANNPINKTKGNIMPKAKKTVQRKDEFVLVRGQSSGVFVGYLKARIGREVELIDSRRVWYWAGAATLSELAQRGTSNPNKCKWPCVVAHQLVLDAIEIIAVTPKARLTYNKVPVWTA